MTARAIATALSAACLACTGCDLMLSNLARGSGGDDGTGDAGNDAGGDGGQTGEPCPGFGPDDPCCYLDDPCGWGDDGMCDCDGMCPWDLEDCAVQGDCAQPIVVDALPFHHLASTADTSNSVSGYGAGCGAGAYPGRDAAYEVQVGQGSEVSVTVIPEPAYDPVVAVIDLCADGEECAAFADDAGPGEAETLSFTAPEADPWYVVVDGRELYEGTYSISIE